MNKIYLIFNFLVLINFSLSKCFLRTDFTTAYCKDNVLNMTNLNFKCALEWEKRYYYNKSAMEPFRRCQFFWYGGCDWMDEHLVYKTEHECYASCEKDSKLFVYFNDLNIHFYI